MTILFALIITFISPTEYSYNLACGLKPLLPLGCTDAMCVCDGSGTNCEWEFICG